MKHSSEKPLKVFIADDHEVVRRGIRMILSETDDLEVVGEAADGSEVLQKLNALKKVDVLVMDYDMPVKSGLDTLIELKAIRPDLPVIILSIFPEDHYGTRFLKAGAAGYLGKASASDQLVDAIRIVARGGKFISPQLTDKLVSELNRETEKLPHETLTDREFQVFHLLVTGKKPKAIADELCLSINTVSTYKTRVFEKMDMKNIADLVHYAIKNNLIQ
jgi:two-component system invasion response regulator UvrY